MEYGGSDVLDTEILYWTKRCIGSPMAFSLSPKPRSTCGMGSIQDFGIHGAAWDPPTRSGLEQGQTPKRHRRIPHRLRHRLWRYRHRHIHSPKARWPSLWQGKKLCIFLEYTRAMDTNEEWAEKKEQEKIDRYSSHLGFINHLSNREKSGWKASQTNFTTGVRGSLHTNQFLTRLESLGVKNTNTREAIRNRTVQKTLSMSEMILKFFFIALTSKTDWTLQNLPTENKNMERFNLHLQPPRLWPDHTVEPKARGTANRRNLTHIYVSKIRAQNILTLNTLY